MSFLYWRGKSLWCRYPINGVAARFPLNIHTTGNPSDKKRCEALGTDALAAIRVRVIEGKFFDKKPEEEAHPYRPKVWRLIGQYCWYHLRFTKSEPYSLQNPLKKFGSLYWDEIQPAQIETWLNSLKLTGKHEINSINRRLEFLKAAFNRAVKEGDKAGRKIPYNPIANVEPLPGAKIRTFLLTQKKFERNYAWLVKNRPHFACFYLGNWETGRRPRELSTYTWEQISEMEMDGKLIHVFSISPDVTKSDSDLDVVPISDRLWHAMNQQAWRTGFVFRNERARQWKSWRRPMAALKEEYADCGWLRDNRRGFVTHKTEVEKKDPAHVKACSGHKTDAIFARYRIGQLRNKMAVVFSESPKISTEKSTNPAQAAA